MTVIKNLNGTELVVELAGRLDTTTAPQLEEELGNLEGVNTTVFDFANLEYISSAGLRILLATYKTCAAKGGNLSVKNANDTIKEVFEITGLSDILTIL